MSSSEGTCVVMNEVESSLVSEVKETQDKELILFDLKANDHKQKLINS